MKFLVLIGLLAALSLWPFVALKRPWAVRLWRRARLIFIAYVLVIFVAAIVRLAFGWGDIYG
jgi:hypothetical protein